jgi:hypothetical protein
LIGKSRENTGIDLDIVQEETLVDESVSYEKKKGRKKKNKGGKSSVLKVKDLEEDAKGEESPDTEDEEDSEEGVAK